MDYFKVFVGSSIVEFKELRLNIKSFIGRVNDEYAKQGMYIDLFECEGMSQALQAGRKQDEINNQIKKSAYAYFIIGKSIGNKTLEEFDVALECFQRTGQPKIFTYFKYDIDDNQIEYNVKAFMTRLDQELNHYYSIFQSGEKIMLDMLMEFNSRAKSSKSLEFSDGQAKLNGNTVFSIEGLPSYSSNESLKQKREELDLLNDRYMDLWQKFSESSKHAVFVELCSVSEQREKVHSEINKIEKAIQENLTFIANHSAEQNHDKRITKAMGLIEDGFVPAANAILQDELWVEEIKDAEELIKKMVKACSEYINGQLLLISSIKTQGITRDNENEILDIYEKTYNLAKKTNCQLHVGYEYSEFLFAQGDYIKAKDVAEETEHYYCISEEIEIKDYVELYFLMAKIYRSNKSFESSKDYYKKALDTALMDAQVNIDELLIVDIYNDYAELFRNLAEYEMELKQLKMAEELLSKDCSNHETKAYNQRLSSTYNKMAVYYNHFNEIEKAIEYHLKAIALREKNIDESNPDNENAYAASCNNLAVIYKKIKEYDQAEFYYKKGITLREKLIEKNPTKYERGLSILYSNISELYVAVARFDDALKYCKKALDIRESLSKMNSNAYSDIYANTCGVMGDILHEMGQDQEATKYYKLAYEIYKELYCNNNIHYAPKYAEICCEYATALTSIGIDQQAEELFLEAVDIATSLVEKDAGFSRLMATACEQFAKKLFSCKKRDMSIKYMTIAVEKWGELVDKNEGAFSDEYERARESLQKMKDNII